MRISNEQDTGEQTITAKASDVAAVLRDIIRTRTPERIARERNIPRTVVEAVRDAHGHPHMATMRQHFTDLNSLGDQKVTFAVDAAHATRQPIPEPAPETPAAPATAAAPADPPTNPPPTAPAPSPHATPAPARAQLKLEDLTALADAPIAKLILECCNHDEPAVQKLAQRINTLVGRLRTDVRRSAPKQLARANRERIAALKAELATLQGKPAKPAATPTATHTCPECGRGFVSSQGLTLHNTRTHRAQPAQAAS